MVAGRGISSTVAGTAGAGIALSQQVLRTDASGMPLEWIDYKEAVRLHCLGQVAYAFGSRLYALHGGTNARTGRQTVIEVNSMMATQGSSGNPGSLRGDYVPPLNNETLFRRDANLCMYCGGRFGSSQLSRDHVRPFCQGGKDVWNNVVAACRRCNNHKASRTPEQAGMQLLAVDRLTWMYDVSKLLIPHDGHPNAFSNELIAGELKKRLRGS